MNKIKDFKQKEAEYNKARAELDGKISALQKTSKDLMVKFGRERIDFLNSLDLNIEEEFKLVMEYVDITAINTKIKDFVSKKCFPFVFNGVRNPIRLDVEEHLNYLRDNKDIKYKLEYLLSIIDPKDFEIQFDSCYQKWCTIKFKNAKTPTELEFTTPLYGGIQLYMDIDKIDSQLFYYHVRELYLQQFDDDEQ